MAAEPVAPESIASDPFAAEGLALDQALEQVLAALRPLDGEERLPLAAALGRVSAEVVRAPADVPGFRASILDGYGIADDTPPPRGSRWRVRGRAAAGAPWAGTIAAGEAIRILTGAPVPDGVQRVLAQELVAVEGDVITLEAQVGPNPWIRSAHEEAAADQVLLEPGVRLTPATLGRLAGCGLAAVAVRPRPRIGLLSSGDELVAPGEERAAGQIWESNGTLLEALLRQLGYGVAERRVAADDPAALREALLALADRCDVVVSTGGVSAGDTDWIRPLLAEMGTVSFWKLFLKPGRPFAFGWLGGRPFFGLPGNPVAAAVTALQLLWPALQCLEGAEPQRLPRLRVRLAAPLRRKPGRPELVRAHLMVAADGAVQAELAGSQASSRIGSLQGADLLLEIPAEQGDLEAGALLWAQLLRLPMF